MAEETDLIWDHAADVQFESSDMARGVKRGHSTFYREDGIKLTCDQAHELLSVLDTTREVLRNYIECAEESHPLSDSSWSGRYRQFPRLHRFGQKVLPKIFRNITVITVVLQAFNLLILTLIDIWPKKDDYTVLVASASSMIILQVLNLIAIIYTSVILAKQLIHRKATPLMLAQNYLASILLFAGIYTLTYRLQPQSWKFIQEDLSSDPVLVVVLYSKFLFFSVSTATLCGSDNALPTDWYNCLFAAFQMLLSFVYFASILGQTMTPKLADIIGKTNPAMTPKTILPRRQSYGSTSSRGSVTAEYSINTNHVVNLEPASGNT